MSIDLADAKGAARVSGDTPYPAREMEGERGPQGEADEVLRPIASLIGKSEKAIQKLPVGTWQHTMLQSNLKALYIASALLREEEESKKEYAREDLREAQKAVNLMIGKTQKAKEKFARGTAHHTLAKNRIHALQIAADSVERALLEKESGA